MIKEVRLECCIVALVQSRTQVAKCLDGIPHIMDVQGNCSEVDGFTKVLPLDPERRFGPWEARSLTTFFLEGEHAADSVVPANQP